MKTGRICGIGEATLPLSSENGRRALIGLIVGACGPPRLAVRSLSSASLPAVAAPPGRLGVVPRNGAGVEVLPTVGKASSVKHGLWDGGTASTGPFGVRARVVERRSGEAGTCAFGRDTVVFRRGEDVGRGWVRIGRSRGVGVRGGAGGRGGGG